MKYTVADLGKLAEELKEKGFLLASLRTMEIKNKVISFLEEGFYEQEVKEQKVKEIKTLFLEMEGIWEAMKEEKDVYVV